MLYLGQKSFIWIFRTEQTPNFQGANFSLWTEILKNPVAFGIRSNIHEIICFGKSLNHKFHIWNSIFLVEFSGNIGRNGFLTSIASQKIFRPYFQKSRLEYYFLCLFYFLSPFSGHFMSDFVVLLLLLTARSRMTRKADQKCPEKQDKKSKRDMKTKMNVHFFEIE